MVDAAAPAGAAGLLGHPPDPGGLAGWAPSAFSVSLENFQGPFDLLLALISKHQLDVTEIALSQVTDDFIAHIRAAGAAWDLGQATEFLVVAATLLDLKTARLLPGPAVEDDEDLALLEARDLLFARLLQYRAYKQAAAFLDRAFAAESLRRPRLVSMEEPFAELLPDLVLGITPVQLAELAARALRPRAEPMVDIEHVHGNSTVSVREQTAILRERLRRLGGGSFRALTADCASTLEVVARFLGLLELYREGLVSFEQLEALGELQVRWTGSDDTDDPDGLDLTDGPDGPESLDKPRAAAGAEWDADDREIDDADEADDMDGADDRTGQGQRG